MIPTKLPSLLLLAASFLLPMAAYGQAPLAKVNGVSIPQSRLETIMKVRAASKQPDSPEVRNAIRDEIISREIVAQEAIRKGLDKSPDVAARLDFQRNEALVDAYLQDYFRTNPITDDAIKKQYEVIKPTIPSRELKARHILVDKEDEAKEIVAQIRKGGSFEKLAAEKSKDPGSKARGGDLDWSPAGRYVKPFGDALAKLKKGQMTDTPVQTEFGWHVIRLDDERAVKVPTMDELKPQITQMLQQQQIQKAVSDLRAKAKVE